MLNDIARDLSGRQWSAVMPTTPDFFAYVTDVELVDLHRNIKKSCLPDMLRSLKSRGLLKGLGR